MEANEVMIRIVWRHIRLLVLMVLLPIAVVLPLRLTQPVNYSATADVQTQASALSASTQASSILSQVSAIATSPAVVQRAIDAAGVNRNAIDVAKHQISTSSLNSSGIVGVTVKDPNRQVAARLSSALAAAIVAALNAPGAAASQQLHELAVQEAQLKSAQTNLESQLSADQRAGLATTDPQVQASVTELTGVETQLASNQTAQQQILSNSNANVDASVISLPTVATTTSASRDVVVDVALAGLLGLIIGLLIATVDELVRPTVADPEAGARELGVLFLGNAEMSGRDADKGSVALESDLMTKMHLAADRLGVLTLVFTGPIPAPQLSQLAAEMNRRLAEADASRERRIPAQPKGVRPAASTNGRNGRKNGHALAVKAPALAIGAPLSTPKVLALSELGLESRPDAPSILLALRRFAPRKSLDRVADLGEATGWPILGVVGVRQTRRNHGRRAVPESTLDAGADQNNGAPPVADAPAATASTPTLAASRELHVSGPIDRQGQVQ